MSLQLANIPNTVFDEQVKHAYQGMQILRDAVNLRTGVVGLSVKFRRQGRVVAVPRITQTMVPLSNTGHSEVTATLTNWIASDMTDKFDQQKTNIDEQMHLVETLSSAIGRRCDQLVLDALQAATTGLTNVDTNVGGAASGLNIAKLRRASQQLKLKEGTTNKKSKMFIAASPRGQEQLLGETPATSMDFNSVKALVDGTMDSFMGFTFKWIGDRAEGGLGLSGGVRTGFAWKQEAVGLAIGLEDVRRTHENLFTSDLANFGLVAGSVVIDEEGYVDLAYTE